MLARIIERISDFVPQKIKDGKIRPLLRYAGSHEDLDKWLGKRLLLAFLLGAAGLLLPWTILPGIEGFEILEYEFYVELLNFSFPAAASLVSLILGFALFAVVILLYYLHLYYVIEGRANLVENILPDFLLLVSANLRAGMTPFAAFRSSSRSEFGPLAEEVRIAASKSLGTSSFSDALKQLSLRIRSRTLKETVAFFTHALQSGGHLAKLLETTALDLRKTQELKKDLQSSTKMYVLFVVFVVVIATPLLMAVSVKFIDMVSIITARTAKMSGTLSGLSLAELQISVEFMRALAYILFFGNGLLASVFMGTLSSGKGLMGLKYFPIIVIASIIVFTISEYVVSVVINFG